MSERSEESKHNIYSCNDKNMAIKMRGFNLAFIMYKLKTTSHLQLKL